MLININQLNTYKDSHALYSYLKDVYNYLPLDTATLKELLQKAHDGDSAAYEKLVKHNLRFVISVAKKYDGDGLDLEDLIQEGNLGLMQAIQYFDPSVEYTFLNYAVWWIRQKISKYVSQHKYTIRVPMSQQLKIKNASPLDDDQPMMPIYAPREDDRGRTIEDLKDPDYSDVTEITAQERQRVVDEVLSVLDDKTKDIVRSFYGIGCKQLHRSEIGKKYGVCGERIRQIVNKALKQIRKTAKADLVEFFYEDL